MTAGGGAAEFRDLRSPKKYPDSKLSSAQLQVLSSICDAVFPSLPLPELDLSGLAEASGNPKRVQACQDVWKMSASSQGVSDLLPGWIATTQKPLVVALVQVFLWMLSTRIGTLLLTGRSSLVRTFPFVESFPQLPSAQREHAILEWGRSFLLPLRGVCKLLVFGTMAILCMKMDDKGWNRVWDAIGYTGPQSAPPTSASSSCPHTLANGTKNGKERTDDDKRPLEGSVVDCILEGHRLEVALRQAGCDVTAGPMDGAVDAELLSKGTRGKKVLLLQCDAVVIGSGCGGGVVAGVLASAGHRVLVLEKGGYFARRDLALKDGPALTKMYDRDSALVVEDGSIALLAGSVVGGGSTVNWGASFRTPPHVIREWVQKHKLKRFEDETYKHDMDAVCERINVQSSDIEHNFPNSVLWEASQKLGYPVMKIPHNSVGPHNCGCCGMGCRNGVKMSTAESWLVDAARAGAVVIAGCQAVSIAHKKGGEKGRRAVGVVAKALRVTGETSEMEGEEEETILLVKAKIVVAACGSIHTPVLLRRSGLKNSNIGKNLRLHPATMVTGYIPERVGWAGGKSYNGTIMSACSLPAAHWDTSGYGALIQTSVMQPLLYAGAVPFRGAAAHKHAIFRFDRTVSLVVITRDQGRGGQVRVDPQGEPAVYYDFNKTDEANMKEGIAAAARILIAAGAEKLSSVHSEMEEVDLTSITDPAELEQLVAEMAAKEFVKNKIGLFTAHQLGSCRMATTASEGVVDEDCESWEVSGLYLGDASVLPTSLGVNPMVSVESIAYGTAQRILRRFQSTEI